MPQKYIIMPEKLLIFKFTANLKKSNSNRKDIMTALECAVEGSREKSSIEYCRYYWLSKATKDPIFLSRNDTIIARQIPIFNIYYTHTHTHGIFLTACYKIFISYVRSTILLKSKSWRKNPASKECVSNLCTLSP